jgi:hypothetical protein
MSDLNTGGSCSSGKEHLSYINRKGGKILLHAGYEYMLKIKHKSGLIIWECTNSYHKSLFYIVVDVVKYSHDKVNEYRIHIITCKGMAKSDKPFFYGALKFQLNRTLRSGVNLACKF